MFLNRNLVAPLLQSGKFVGITFQKKDGSYRRLNGRCGVGKFTNGKGLSFDPATRGMIVMWEADTANRKGESDKGYRFVTLSRVKEVRANGEVYTVVG